MAGPDSQLSVNWSIYLYLHSFMTTNNTLVIYFLSVHMAVPDFAAGAMENWGLILYRETALLYEEGVSSSAYRQRVTYVIAHELAHMVSTMHVNLH